MVQVGAGWVASAACWAIAGLATQGNSAAIHRTTAYPLFIKILLSAVVVVVLAIVLSRFANDRSDTRACCTGNQGPFDAAPECGPQHSAGCATDECAFARANSTLVLLVSVMVVVVASAVVAPTDAAVCPVVELAVVVLAILLQGGYPRTQNRTAEKSCGRQERSTHDFSVCAIICWSI